MKKSEFLRAAVRECLAERSIYGSNNPTIKSKFLCTTLDLYATQLGTAEARATSFDIQYDITRSIEHSITVISWLHDKLNWPPGYRPTNGEQYAYRLRWAEHMAQEYEAKGD